MTPQTAALMAHYNRWVNERMYQAAASLDAAALTADRGAYFGSILGTLNHIAVADNLWLHRFARYEAGFTTLGVLADLPKSTSLTQPLATDLAGLCTNRERLDERIEHWVAELTPEHLASCITYSNMAGVASSRRLGALLQHFFNHQTHHRGQASTLLFQAGVDVGVTDLLALIPTQSE